MTLNDWGREDRRISETSARVERELGWLDNRINSIMGYLEQTAK